MDCDESMESKAVAGGAVDDVAQRWQLQDAAKPISAYLSKSMGRRQQTEQTHASLLKKYVSKLLCD